VLNLVLLTKDAGGSIEASELRDVGEDELGELLGLEADLAVLLAAEDIEKIGDDRERSSASL
jgi:hypothetical protein